MTKNQFCQRHNIEPQAFRRFVQLDLLRVRTVWLGKAKRLLIEPDEINRLQEGEHFVVCPFCGRKAIELFDRHYKVCPQNHRGENPGYRASAFFAVERVKTEEQKRKQSLRLKRRFQTPEGEITRRQISEASRSVSSVVRAKKTAVLLRVNRDPARREQVKRESLERWQSPDFRRKIASYQNSNRVEILKSAARARSFKVYKKSSLHELFKKAMIGAGILDFDSEYRVGFYSVDEANERLKLAVEIDDCYWHGCKECGYQGIRGTQNTDRRKEGYLRTHG